MSLLFLFPLGVAISSVTASIYAVWYLSARQFQWVRQTQEVRCPQDGQAADIEVVTGPNRWEILVTSMLPDQSCVTRCSRFANGRVTCAQGCLGQQPQ